MQGATCVRCPERLLACFGMRLVDGHGVRPPDLGQRCVAKRVQGATCVRQQTPHCLLSGKHTMCGAKSPKDLFSGNTIFPDSGPCLCRDRTLNHRAEHPCTQTCTGLTCPRPSENQPTSLAKRTRGEKHSVGPIVREAYDVRR